MQHRILGTLLLGLFACGPSYGGQDVKTPEEIVEEQERLAAEQEKNKTDYSGPTEETDLEKKAKFDKKQTELELKRATRSAETCGAVVPEPGPSGTAKVTLTFANDGHVKEATVSAPFDGTEVGKCVVNAYKAVIVPRFEGPEERVDWEAEVAPKPEPEDPKKKKK